MARFRPSLWTSPNRRSRMETEVGNAKALRVLLGCNRCDLDALPMEIVFVYHTVTLLQVKGLAWRSLRLFLLLLAATSGQIGARHTRVVRRVSL